MGLFKNILTGKNNETFAFGRVSAFSLFVLAVLLVVPAEVFTVGVGWITVRQWGDMLAQWQTYIPAVGIVVYGWVRGLASTEPQDKD